jgi:membrane-associated phospholipid phosphatase
VAVLAALVSGLYVLAVGTRIGRETESALYVNPDPTGDWVWAAAIATVNGWTLPVLAVLAAVVAARNHGVRAGIAVAVLVTGANLSTYVLERGLEGLDPVGGERLRVLGEGFFPSGHATAAMSLGCGAVLAVPASRAPLISLVMSAYVATVGVALVTPGNHHLSDVLAGMLIAAAWARLALPAHGSAPMQGRLVLGAAVLLGVVGGCLSAVVSGLPPYRYLDLVIAGGLVTVTAFIVAHMGVRRRPDAAAPPAASGRPDAANG